MNLSQLITRIKINTGLYTISLPVDNVDSMLEDVIKNITLRTFSTYSPYYETVRLNLNSLELLEKKSNYESYLLPDIFSQRELLFIRNIEYDESTISGIGYWGGGVPLLHGNMINQSILSNAGMQLTNKMIPKLTFKYEHPRKVTLYNVLSSCTLMFELAFMHDKSLASISPTEEESFYELALLDCKVALYSIAKHYDDIQSAYGNINLKIDDWAQAESDRKELIQDWSNTYHMDVTSFEYY